VLTKLKYVSTFHPFYSFSRYIECMNFQMVEEEIQFYILFPLLIFWWLLSSIFYCCICALTHLHINLISLWLKILQTYLKHFQKNSLNLWTLENFWHICLIYRWIILQLLLLFLLNQFKLIVYLSNLSLNLFSYLTLFEQNILFSSRLQERLILHDCRHLAHLLI
jgi:hypothetical protein